MLGGASTFYGPGRPAQTASGRTEHPNGSVIDSLDSLDSLDIHHLLDHSLHMLHLLLPLQNFPLVTHELCKSGFVLLLRCAELVEVCILASEGVWN